MNQQEYQETNKWKTISVILILLIIIVGLFYLVNIYVIPKLKTKYISEGYNLGITDSVNYIVSQIESKGYVQMTLSNNKTMVLVPYIP